MGAGTAVWPPQQFQSTRPTRSATNGNGVWLIAFMFQSTRPTRSATGFQRRFLTLRAVSIHTPHAERDTRCPVAP